VAALITWTAESPAWQHDPAAGACQARTTVQSNARKNSRHSRGQHQVPDQAGPDQREAPPAQQVGPLGRAVESGDAEKATELQRAAARALDKAASKGVIHKNQAANRKSAMAKRTTAA
jgi:hypothetical protein